MLIMLLVGAFTGTSHADSRLRFDKLIFDSTQQVSIDVSTELDQLQIVNANLKTQNAEFGSLNAVDTITANTTTISDSAEYSIPFFYAETEAPIDLPNEDTSGFILSGLTNFIDMTLVSGSDYGNAVYTAPRAGKYFLECNISYTTTMNNSEGANMGILIVKNAADQFAYANINVRTFAYDSGAAKIRTQTIIDMNAGDTASFGVGFIADHNITVSKANFMGWYISE